MAAVRVLVRLCDQGPLSLAQLTSPLSLAQLTSTPALAMCEALPSHVQAAETHTMIPLHSELALLAQGALLGSPCGRCQSAYDKVLW
jgi:hypothetical protein